MAVKRNQTFHETLIPLLVEGIGAKSYLEFGTHLNETIGKVRCERRYGVDVKAQGPEISFQDYGIAFFKMTTQEFIEKHAARFAPFDVVFIDAEHSAPNVLADFLQVWEYVSSNGLVILHDTNPETVNDTDPGLCGDAWKAARALWDGDHEVCTLPYHPGLTIVRKRTKWGPQE